MEGRLPSVGRHPSLGHRLEARFRILAATSIEPVPSATPLVSQACAFLAGVRASTWHSQNLECHRPMNQLVKIEDEGTGRVPLSRFYRGGLDGDETFGESVDFLRHAVPRVRPAKP